MTNEKSYHDDIPLETYEEFSSSEEVHKEFEHPHESERIRPESSVTPLREKLLLLLRMEERVSNPSWALSLDEFDELVIDLGLLLQNSDIKLGLNPSIGEDPRDISDDLGNVKMFHRGQKYMPSDLYQSMGTAIVDLVHQVRSIFHRQQVSAEKVQELTYSLEAYDDSSSEDILNAKMLISKLRRDNMKLDRHNESLWIENSKLKDRIDRLKDRTSNEKFLELLLKRQKDQAMESTPSVDAKSLTVLSWDGESDLPITQTRNLRKAELHSSQLKDLKW